MRPGDEFLNSPLLTSIRTTDENKNMRINCSAQEAQYASVRNAIISIPSLILLSFSSTKATIVHIYRYIVNKLFSNIILFILKKDLHLTIFDNGYSNARIINNAKKLLIADQKSSVVILELGKLTIPSKANNSD